MKIRQQMGGPAPAPRRAPNSNAHLHTSIVNGHVR